MDYSVRVTDLAIVFATFFGPIFALWAQKRLDRSKALRDTQEQLFKALMAGRATWLEPVRVQALNMIPIVFYGKKKSLREIDQAHRALLHHFEHVASEDEWQKNAWQTKRLELDVKLLRAVGSHLGYVFPELDLETQHYFPVAHTNRILEEQDIRNGLAKILSGRASLPVINTLPDDIFKQICAMREDAAKILAGEQPLPVSITTEKKQSDDDQSML